MLSPYLTSHNIPADFIPLSENASQKAIPDYFEEVALKFPEKLAVNDHVRSLTYAQVRQYSNNVAATVNKVLGHPTVSQAIGLIFEPTVESVIGIMGTLRSGHFICPISPNDPPARILSYLEDANIELILSTRDAFPQNLQPILKSTKVVFVEELISENAESLPPRPRDPDQLASILYTSGSTGKPKGVTHTHRTLMQMIRNKGNELGLSKSDRIAGMARFTFGSYYLNVFAALLCGSTLHIYDFFQLAFDGLKQWLIERQITLFHCTPTTLRQFLDALDEPTEFPDLRLVSLGGETLYPKDVYRIQEMISSPLAVCTTGAAIETWFYSSVFFRTPFPPGVDQIPMGYTNPECRVDIRDDNGNILPIGETGEISVMSAALSPGYWKRPELNALKYVADEENKRYFRTGDLGVFSPDGILYHKGRMDFQIKIRGMRVDLGEIETALHSHPDIRQAVVTGHTRKDNDTELIAYFSASSDSKPSRGEIYEFLAARLSPHQIPTRTIFLESFPLTRTHKIDRNALPDPDEIEITSDSERVAPRNDIEARLHEIWAELLGHKEFGVTDSFLEVGGDSLSAMRIRVRIEAEYKSSIRLHDFFISGTIESLGSLIQQYK
jgi:amino acid adenylation domain-containing protein